MAKRTRILAALGASLALSGCSSLELPSFDFGGFGDRGDRAAPVAAGDLPPAEIPAYAQGDTFVYDQDGAISQERVVSVSPDRVVWTDDESSSSVIWTRDPYIVTPPLNWSAHPELGRGRQAIIGSPEELFPLREGNMVAYAVRGSSETVPEGWQDEHRCTVFGQTVVEVTAGTYATYRIDCQRRDYADTLYYSPVVQNVVLRERDFGDRRSRKELVSVKLANDRTADLAATTPIAPPPAVPTPTIAADEPAMPPAGTAPGLAEPTGDMMAPPAPIQARIDRLERAVERLEKAAGLAPMGTAATAETAGEPTMRQTGDAAPGMTAGAGSGPWAVHLASYRSLRRAETGWTTLNRRFPQLGALTMRTSEFDPGNGRGTYIRLLAQGFENRRAANAFCAPIKSAGQFCQARGPLP